MQKLLKLKLYDIIPTTHKFYTTFIKVCNQYNITFSRDRDCRYYVFVDGVCLKSFDYTDSCIKYVLKYAVDDEDGISSKIRL